MRSESKSIRMNSWDNSLLNSRLDAPKQIISDSLFRYVLLVVQMRLQIVVLKLTARLMGGTTDLAVGVHSAEIKLDIVHLDLQKSHCFSTPLSSLILL